MKPDLHITALQVPLVWEETIQNREFITKQLHKFSEKTDLVLLPEMFTSGFTMNPEAVAETMKGDTILWMKEWATKLGSAIGGSLVIKEGNKFYNRFIFISPEGEVNYYDKRHPFTLAGEHLVYSSGFEEGIIEYKGWKICLRICYDLRFPVWSRNTHNYDVLIYVANWPKPRINAWDVLLQARAIENMSYVFGVNRIGGDEKGHIYPGRTAAYDGLGNCISEASVVSEFIINAKLNYLKLQELRKKLRFLEDRDNFEMY
ncbi:MAG: amidohydrolase [Flavobacteriaceae bacterium]|jgi:omega-amidase|nr:amidohydrolase [Flavobacteriaceae bacterium]